MSAPTATPVNLLVAPSGVADLDEIRLENDRRMASLFLKVALIPMIALAWVDGLVLGWSVRALATSWTLRVVSVVLLLVFIHRIRTSKTRSEFDDTAFLAALYIAGVLLCFRLLRPPPNITGIRIEFLFLVSSVAMLPTRPWRHTVITLTLGIGSILLLILYNTNVAPAEIVSIAILYFLGVTVGASIARHRITSMERETTIWQAERQLRASLTTTLAELHVLKGVIPICAHCKNVRLEQGDWQRLELYVREHSDADFSHGICPDCEQKHYPAYLQRDAVAPH